MSTLTRCDKCGKEQPSHALDTWIKTDGYIWAGGRRQKDFCSWVCVKVYADEQNREAQQRETLRQTRELKRAERLLAEKP